MTRVPLSGLAGRLLWVWLGGTLGTAARYGLTGLVSPGSAPLVVLGINLLGALVLAVLVQLLAMRADSPGARSVRLALGTGLLGGFTTYSALAVDTGQLAADGRAGWAAVYGLSTVLLGALASWLGLVAAARWGRWPWPSTRRRS